MKASRRTFLKTSLATASIAACSLAERVAAKSNSPPGSITDTYSYVGHWPLRTLPNVTPETLRAGLQRDIISQTWVGSFDALFHKDIAAVNGRLAEICSRSAAGTLIPFGAVNPTLPDWEDDVHRCHETFHMPGIRLHPNYHGYNLDDPRFARLLYMAATRGLIVQLVARVDDGKHLWLNPRTPSVDLHPLANDVAEIPGLKLVISGGVDALDDGLAGELARRKNVSFDFAGLGEPETVASEPTSSARRDKPGGSLKAKSQLKALADQVPLDRVLFGSGAPLHPVEAAIAELKQVELKDSDRRAIENGNARTLLTIG